MTMGEKMQKLRKQKNWSQETLAEKLGVSRRRCRFGSAANRCRKSTS